MKPVLDLFTAAGIPVREGTIQVVLVHLPERFVAHHVAVRLIFTDFTSWPNAVVVPIHRL